MNKRWLFAGLVGGALGGLAARVYTQYQRGISDAYRRVLGGSHLFTTGNGPQEYAVTGNGPPVLVIHGAGGGYDQGLLIASLLGKDFHAICPSRFGYLRSTLPADASPSKQADVYAALLDELNLSAAAVIGFSAGGPSALGFALRYPERCSALIMIAAVSHPYQLVSIKHHRIQKFIQSQDFASWAATRLVRLKLLSLPKFSQNAKTAISPAEVELMVRLMDISLPVSERYHGRLNDYAQINALEEFPFDSISVPTLVIHAEDDITVPVEHAYYAAQRIPDTELVTLPSGGHVLLGQHDKVKSIVLKFLNQHVRA